MTGRKSTEVIHVKKAVPTTCHQMTLKDGKETIPYRDVEVLLQNMELHHIF